MSDLVFNALDFHQIADALTALGLQPSDFLGLAQFAEVITDLGIDLSRLSDGQLQILLKAVGADAMGDSADNIVISSFQRLNGMLEKLNPPLRDS